MMMWESLYAIGEFERSLAKYLDFGSERYEKVKDGVSVITNIFTIESSVPEHAQLADCLQIDPFDFNQHKIDPFSVNTDLVIT